MTPIIFLAGKAGSGKDTLAAFIREASPTSICIAQADPLKRFAAKVFGFTEQQLWGPSEFRNALDERYDVASLGWTKAVKAIEDEVWMWANDAGLKGVAAKDGVDWLNELANLSNHQLSPRIALQHLGTEFGRARDRDVWVRYVMKTAKKLLSGGCTYDRALGLVADRDAKIPQFVIVTDVRFANEVLAAKTIGAHVVLVDGLTGDGAPGLGGHSSEAELASIPEFWYTDRVFNQKELGLDALRKSAQALVRDFTPRPNLWIQDGKYRGR